MVRNHMTFTSTADLEFLCRVVNEGRVTWEYSASLDVAPGETGFLSGAVAFAGAARGLGAPVLQHGVGTGGL